MKPVGNGLLLGDHRLGQEADAVGGAGHGDLLGRDVDAGEPGDDPRDFILMRFGPARNGVDVADRGGDDIGVTRGVVPLRQNERVRGARPAPP